MCKLFLDPKNLYIPTFGPIGAVFAQKSEFLAILIRVSGNPDGSGNPEDFENMCKQFLDPKNLCIPTFSHIGAVFAQKSEFLATLTRVSGNPEGSGNPEKLFFVGG